MIRGPEARASTALQAMTLQLNGITYSVIRTVEFNHNGNDRVEYVMKRPRGRVEYRVVRYENGTFSSVW
jgi:hypothetical protein